MIDRKSITCVMMCIWAGALIAAGQDATQAPKERKAVPANQLPRSEDFQRYTRAIGDARIPADLQKTKGEIGVLVIVRRIASIDTPRTRDLATRLRNDLARHSDILDKDAIKKPAKDPAQLESLTRPQMLELSPLVKHIGEMCIDKFDSTLPDPLRCALLRTLARYCPIGHYRVASTIILLENTKPPSKWVSELASIGLIDGKLPKQPCSLKESKQIAQELVEYMLTAKKDGQLNHDRLMTMRSASIFILPSVLMFEGASGSDGWTRAIALIPSYRKRITELREKADHREAAETLDKYLELLDATLVQLKQFKRIIQLRSEVKLVLDKMVDAILREDKAQLRKIMHPKLRDQITDLQPLQEAMFGQKNIKALRIENMAIGGQSPKQFSINLSFVFTDEDGKTVKQNAEMYLIQTTDGLFIGNGKEK